MLIDFKLQRDDEHTNWRILWQFSSLCFLLLWLYHLMVFVSSCPSEVPAARGCPRFRADL